MAIFCHLIVGHFLALHPVFLPATKPSQPDDHFGRCACVELLARDDRNDTRLFDWDAWRIAVGASDLAHMTAVHYHD